MSPNTPAVAPILSPLPGPLLHGGARAAHLHGGAQADHLYGGIRPVALLPTPARQSSGRDPTSFLLPPPLPAPSFLLHSPGPDSTTGRRHPVAGKAAFGGGGPPSPAPSGANPMAPASAVDRPWGSPEPAALQAMADPIVPPPNGGSGRDSDSPSGMDPGPLLHAAARCSGGGSAGGMAAL